MGVYLDTSDKRFVEGSAAVIEDWDAGIFYRIDENFRKAGIRKVFMMVLLGYAVVLDAD